MNGPNTSRSNGPESEAGGAGGLTTESRWRCRKCCDNGAVLFAYPKHPDVTCSECSSPLTFEERQVEVFFMLATEERRLNAHDAHLAAKNLPAEEHSVQAAVAGEKVELQKKLSEISTQLKSLKEDKSPALLLSKREAAKLLKIDRGATLNRLIDTGQLRTVQANGAVKISRREVERLATEGFNRDAPKAKKPSKLKKQGLGGDDRVEVGTAIRALKL